ncbi:MAG TPA: sugar ABC transporter permease [Spirochaetia bacterium]|nr:sugar ABC transporter permease [Spirochaetia bacterium]
MKAGMKTLTYEQQKRRLGYWMVLPVFVVVFGVMVGFAAYTLILSLQNINLIGTQGVHFTGFASYAAVFHTKEMLAAIRNSLVWVGLSTAAVVLLGLAVGSILSDAKGVSRFARSIMLVPWVLPGVVVAGVWKWMFGTQNGVINALLGSAGILHSGIAWLGTPGTVLYAVIVVIVWRLFPLFSLVVASSVQMIDVSLYEAGKVDGMNGWQGFLHITLPGIQYQLLTMGLLNMIWIMNNLVLVNVMTGGGPLYYSETLPVYMYKLGFQYTKLSQAAAVTMVNFVMLLAISMIYVYFFRRAQKARESV